MSFTFDIKGTVQLGEKIKKIPASLKRRVDGEIVQTLTEINAEQIRRAPVDRGPLRQNTSWEKVNDGGSFLNYELFCNVPYAAYVEFGTRRKFKGIPGVDSSKYRGKGRGDYYDFLNAILDWVKRKGIASTYSTGIVKNRGGKKSGYSLDLTKSGRKSTKKEDLLRIAEAIAFSILRNGIKPQPFFFTPFLEKRELLTKRVQEILDKPVE